MKGWQRLLLLAAALAVGLAVGCGRKRGAERPSRMAEAIAEKMIERDFGGEAKVDISGEQITVRSKDGELVVHSGQGVKLPDGFPSDVPVIKGAKILQSVSTADGYSLTLSCNDRVVEIAEFYKQAMRNGGWEEQMTMNHTGGTVLMYAKKQRQVHISITDSDTERMVMLTVAVEK